MDNSKIKHFLSIYNDIDTYPTVNDVCEALNLTERTVRRYASNYKKIKGMQVADRRKVRGTTKSSTKSNVTDDLETSEVLLNAQIVQLKQDKLQLKRELHSAHQNITTASKVESLIHGTTRHDLKKIPKWLTPSKQKSGVTGIPLLFLSDIHFDEIEHASQIGNVNEYNRSIAEARLKHTFEKTVELLKYNMSSDSNYEGIVAAMGGDMLSGMIHEELAETNEGPISKSVIRLSEILITGISLLKDEFGKVFVPCVTGNHGRMHHKKRMKNKVFENYEYFVYHNLAMYFANDKDVTIAIPDGSDISFSLYNTTFLLEHGDNYRGGSGIAGIFSPISLGIHRKNKQQSAINKPFDIALLGHFHQLVFHSSFIINGSVKGYDSYAYNNNFAYEPPQQALFVVHPTLGITYRMPVRCDGYELADKKVSNKIVVL